jgi:hypothetical protein
MSDTPITDASAFWVTSPTDPEAQEEVVASHSARQIERELNAANDLLHDYRVLNESMNDTPRTHALFESGQSFAPLVRLSEMCVLAQQLERENRCLRGDLYAERVTNEQLAQMLKAKNAEPQGPSSAVATGKSGQPGVTQPADSA